MGCLCLIVCKTQIPSIPFTKALARHTWLIWKAVSSRIRVHISTEICGWGVCLEGFTRDFLTKWLLLVICIETTGDCGKQVSRCYTCENNAAVWSYSSIQRRTKSCRMSAAGGLFHPHKQSTLLQHTASDWQVWHLVDTCSADTWTRFGFLIALYC